MKHKKEPRINNNNVEDDDGDDDLFIYCANSSVHMLCQ